MIVADPNGVREQADNPLAAAVDQAVRTAFAEAASKAFDAGETDTSYVLTSVLTGGLSAVVRFVHQFQKPGTSAEDHANALRDMALGLFAQCECNDAGGRA